MALQFFAVHSEALATTHDALQRHASRHGLRPPGPTRALRIAQLYGHLQLRAAGRSSLVLAVSELAACWRFQPRQLRQDLALLQALGWLSARGTTRGTVINLSGSEQGDFQDPDADRDGDSDSSEPEREARPCKGPSSGRDARDDRDPAPFSALPLAPLSDQEATASQACPSGSAGPVVSAPRAASPAPTTPPRAPAASADATRDLLQRLAALYNQHRPATWPAYQPRGNGLRSKLRQALKQAGSAEALADTLRAALGAMPSFWRHTYPQGRSGAECMAVLFCTDRGCAGLGVEFWHLFSWAQAADQGADESAAMAQTARGPASGSAEPVASPADTLQRARKLFLWDSGVWRSQGREALLLTLAEKRELALLLEASGVGIAGTAQRQFAEPEGAMPCREVQGAESIPASQPAASGEPGSSAEGDPAECLLGADQVDDSHGSAPHSHRPGKEPFKPGPRALHRWQHDRSPLVDDLTPQATQSAPGAAVTPNPRTLPGPHRQAAPPERRHPCPCPGHRPIRSSHPAT